MDTTPPNLFHLTDTPFFENLRQGLLSEDLHIQLRDFIVRVHNVASGIAKGNAFSLDTMLIAEIELKKLKSIHQLHEANKALAASVEAAHDYLREKIEEVRSELPNLKLIRKEKAIDELILKWEGNKSEFVEICQALKLANLFGTTPQAKIIRVLGKACGVDVDAQYARNRIFNFQCRSPKSPSVIKKMLSAVQNIVPSSYEEEIDESA